MAKHNNTPEKPKMAPEEALFQALSLCRKAGALTMGFDAVEDACVKSKAWLVMVTSDASAKTVQRLNYAVGDLVDVISMPLTQDRLADISRKPVAVPSSDISFCVSRSSAAALCASSWHLRISRLATKASLMYWQCCRTNSPPTSM